jgi:ribose 5-phosphate isomerase B
MPSTPDLVRAQMTSPQRTRPPRAQRFVVGSDHAGFELKERIKHYLRENGNEVEDFVEQFRPRIDFPPVAEQVGRAVLERKGSYGVLVCATGLGMSIAANKVPGIRAALLFSDAAAMYARSHNDANVLVFAGRLMGFEETRRYIETFFAHDFLGGKYAERNEYIAQMTDRRR